MYSSRLKALFQKHLSTATVPPSKSLWALAAGVTITIFFIFFGYSRSTPATWHSSSTPATAQNVPAHEAIEAADHLHEDIRNATLGFQKIFVINLPSRTDHRDSMALAAHFSGIEVDYIDGVTHVDEKTLPPHKEDLDMHPGVIGAWRAHMNIARTIIEQNITSALILEDDSDWDLRIKDQMQDFAKASKLLLQPRSRSEAGNVFLDSTNPRASEEDEIQNYTFEDGPTIEPTSSPYGDVDLWDILWLGHCGTHFPTAQGEKNTPLGRVTYPDVTVPESQHVEIQFGNDDLVEQYPPHTRAVHRVANNVCTLGYAITLAGARRMLYEFSVNRISSAMDLMLSYMCEGRDGRKMRTCLSVQPQLFNHHRPIGSKAGQSDIAPHPNEYNPVAFSKNIRWSARVNFPKLIDGETDWIDSFPDGAEAQDLGFR